MAKKAEMDARWADLSGRLGQDPKLAEVLEGLDRVLDDEVKERPRRLKVPYVNATTLDDGGHPN